MVFFDDLKPHGFWLTKNTVVFFRISLFFFRMLFSRRSGHSLGRGLNPPSIPHPCCGVICLFSVDVPDAKIVHHLLACKLAGLCDTHRILAQFVCAFQPHNSSSLVR